MSYDIITQSKEHMTITNIYNTKLLPEGREKEDLPQYLSINQTL